MTETDKLRNDLAYVRAAVDRQRRFACEVLPLWLAAIIGGLFIGLTLIKDLETMGRVSESLTDWAVIATAAIAMGALFVRNLARRGARQVRAATALDRRQKRQSGLQALVFIIGIGVIDHALDQAGVSGKLDDIVVLTYFAACMILMGLGGLNLLLWFGVGAGIGTLALLFLDVAFAKTLIGLCIAAGLLLGAWLDRRALARSEG